MKYTVLWTPTAEEDLAEVWLQASDREAVRSAADTLDSLLRNDAHCVANHAMTHFASCTQLRSASMLMSNSKIGSFGSCEFGATVAPDAPRIFLPPRRAARARVPDRTAPG